MNVAVLDREASLDSTWRASARAARDIVVPGRVAPYDNNGSVTAVGTTTSYTYDYQNRLTQSAIGNGHSTTTTSGCVSAETGSIRPSDPRPDAASAQRADSVLVVRQTV
jgi:hypothetical protein